MRLYGSETVKNSKTQILYLAQGLSSLGYLEFVESLLVTNTVGLLFALSN